MTGWNSHEWPTGDGLSTGDMPSLEEMQETMQRLTKEKHEAETKARNSFNETMSPRPCLRCGHTAKWEDKGIALCQSQLAELKRHCEPPDPVVDAPTGILGSLSGIAIHAVTCEVTKGQERHQG